MSASDLVERVRPSFAVDLSFSEAVQLLRAKRCIAAADALNAAIVANNELKREAADALSAHEARIAELELRLGRLVRTGNAFMVHINPHELPEGAAQQRESFAGEIVRANAALSPLNKEGDNG